MNYFKDVERYIRTLCYNFWLGNNIFSVSTPKLYNDMLDYVENNSKILEVGIGSGMPIICNSNKILRKNIHIHGIDIDEQYVESCKEGIVKSHLENNVSVEVQNLFYISEKYDYIVFSESYPVIPIAIMDSMIYHCKQILKPNGQIIFIHNLIDDESQKNHFIAKLKPYIKYIPFVWIDFGRATTIKYFEHWLRLNSLKFQSEILVDEKIPYLLRLLLGDYSIKQYVYICSKNE